MSPQVRATDKFDPEPLPKDEGERIQQQWYTLQEVRFHLMRLNGTVVDVVDDLARIDKDVAVAKKLGWIALLTVGVISSVGGLYAALF